MSLKQLKIVIVGLGLIGPRHAEQVVQNPQTQLFAIIDPSPASAKVVNKLFPNTPLFKNIEELISKTGVIPDGAIVCTPNTTHYNVVSNLIDNGLKNIIVEKPMTTNIDDSFSLQKKVLDNKVNLLVGHHRRFNPYIVNLKENLHRVGKIVAIDGVWTLKKTDVYFKQATWRTNSKQGGGVILINLVHDLDLLQYLNGQISKVYAVSVKNSRGYDVDEGAVIILDFKNGSKGSFIVSDNVISPCNFEMGTGENPLIPKNRQDIDGVFYRFFGTEGTISAPDLRLFHQDKLKEKGWWEPISKESVKGSANLNDAPFTLQLRHFVNVIKGIETPKCTTKDGISVMLVIQAIKKSIETGLPEKVDSFTSLSKL